MEITDPRRILILSPPSTSIAPLLKALVPPSPPSSSPNTSTNNPVDPTTPPSVFPDQVCRLTTRYYTATVPVWTDTIPSLPTWKEEWLALPGASEVVGAIGAWIVAFPQPSTDQELTAIKELLSTVSQVIKHHTQSNYDLDNAELFAVAFPSAITPRLETSADTWEDLCQESGGWEFIDAFSLPAQPAERNEFGETTGLPRLLEALTAIEWEGPDPEGALTPSDSFLEEDGPVDFPLESLSLDAGPDLEPMEEQEIRASMLKEEAGLGVADDEALSDSGAGTGIRQGGVGTRGMNDPGVTLGGGFTRYGEGGEGEEDDGDVEVEALQAMMLKMQAVRDMDADMPEAERRRVARRAVQEIMKTI